MQNSTMVDVDFRVTGVLTFFIVALLSITLYSFYGLEILNFIPLFVILVFSGVLFCQAWRIDGSNVAD